MSRFIDIAGKRFGKLIVIGMSGRRNTSHDILWECKCDCGKPKLATSGALRHGATISCGCMMGNPTHGDWNKRIRIIWVNMMRRCNKATDKQYPLYGGRGIKVCKAWLDYQNFKKWAYENGYTEELTLDRYPNKRGNYSPSNCRWATYKQQANNKLNNTLVKINGERKTIAEWCDYYGLEQNFVLKRQNRGWNIIDAILKPKAKHKRKCLP